MPQLENIYNPKNILEVQKFQGIYPELLNELGKISDEAYKNTNKIAQGTIFQVRKLTNEELGEFLQNLAKFGKAKLSSATEAEQRYVDGIAFDFYKMMLDVYPDEYRCYLEYGKNGIEIELKQLGVIAGLELPVQKEEFAKEQIYAKIPKKEFNAPRIEIKTGELIPPPRMEFGPDNLAFVEKNKEQKEMIYAKNMRQEYKSAKENAKGMAEFGEIKLDYNPAEGNAKGMSEFGEIALNYKPVFGNAKEMTEFGENGALYKSASSEAKGMTSFGMSNIEYKQAGSDAKGMTEFGGTHADYKPASSEAKEMTWFGDELVSYKPASSEQKGMTEFGDDLSEYLPAISETKGMTVFGSDLVVYNSARTNQKGMAWFGESEVEYKPASSIQKGIAWFGSNNVTYRRIEAKAKDPEIESEQRITEHAFEDIPEFLKAGEADLVYTLGRIDNFGFGWPANFDYQGGKKTPVHIYPFHPAPGTPPGLKKIMAGNSLFDKPRGMRADEYSRHAARPEKITLDYSDKMMGINTYSARIEMFVDDFQAPLFRGEFTVTLNGRRAKFLEDVINSLEQTGPCGQFIKADVPHNFLNEIQKGKFEILIDETTGAHDGYAVDFVRILINPGGSGNRLMAQILGIVNDKSKSYIQKIDSFNELSKGNIPKGGEMEKIFLNNLKAGIQSQIKYGIKSIVNTNESYIRKIEKLSKLRLEMNIWSMPTMSQDIISPQISDALKIQMKGFLESQLSQKDSSKLVEIAASGKCDWTSFDIVAEIIYQSNLEWSKKMAMLGAIKTALESKNRDELDNSKLRVLKEIMPQ